MEPQVRYARTDDGVNIAYWVLGEGPPLLYLFPLPSNIEREWQVRRLRRLYEEYGQRHTLIRYDRRGEGLSDRITSGFSIEAYCADIDAVLDAAGVDRSAVVAYGGGAIQAIGYAAMRPERVTKLALLGPNSGERSTSSAIVGLAEANFDAYCETVGSIALGWDASEDARQFAGVLRSSMSAEGLRAALVDNADAGPLLADVQCPTLVVYPRDADPRVLSPDDVRRIAAAIPGARLVVIDGEVPFATGSESATQITEQFFLGEEVTLAPRQQVETTGVPMPATAIVLFADIAESTALTERMGDAAFRAKARDLDAALRSVVREHGGSVIDAKTLGDGILATFPAASQAIVAALACGRAGDQRGLPLHLGLHAGDVIRESDNVFGGVVNIAARISGLSQPGEVLVSRTVADLGRTSAGVLFEDRGEPEMKGVGEAVRVYAVVGQD